MQQLKRKLPGVDPAQYIDFFCLRSWGVMNDRVVHDQIYVHDKVLIVDDRVAIVGSANINDRSMLGERDTEMALRIEDTLHETISLGGGPFVVGKTVHDMRVRFMRQHTGAPTADVDNMTSVDTYEWQWRNIAASNASLYDQLDGEASPYRCKTVTAYTNGLRNLINKSSRDPQVQNIVNSIKGFLVLWPMELFIKDDIAPSAATNVLIPTNLWV